MAVMRVAGWVVVLCALLVSGTMGGREEQGLAKTPSASASGVLLRRFTRSFCTSGITVTPSEEELYWHVGEVQDVWCSVDSSSSTPVNLTILKDTVPLPHQTVNETTIQVTLNLTQPDSYKLICKDNTGNHMCMSQVFVGYEPLEVEELQCVSHNWESFTCNWTVPDNPVQETNNDYLPYLMSADDPATISECTCTDYNNLLGDSCSCPETCCLWSGSSYFAVSSEVVVMFAAENDLGSAVFNYTIDNYAVVLPNAMKEVTVDSVAGRLEAQVGWVLPAPMGTFAEDAAGVVVRVDHRLTDDGGGRTGDWMQGEVVLCHGDTCKTGQQVVPLEHWWRRYEVRVRLRSAAAPQPAEEDGWWSDWQPRYVNASATAPDTPSGVGPGTFEVVGRGFEGLTDLTLVWQTLPTLLHNGPDFRYLAQLCRSGDDINGELRSEALEEVVVTTNFAVFQNVSSSESYLLQVSAQNSEGGGPWAAVRVAAASVRPALPLLPVVVQHSGAKQDTLYELRWEPVGEGTYTVYLCTGEQEGAWPCTGQLYWVSAGNTSSANLTLRDFGLQDAAPSIISFAVSAEDAANVSSGLSWDSCGTPEPYRNVLGPPIPDKPITSSSSVELPWTLSCSFWADVVEKVEAVCCRGRHASPDNCTEEQVAATGQPWTGKVSVSGLEAGQEYTAWLRLHYRGGASPWADSETFTTDPAGVEAWLIVVVVGVGVLATVVIVFGLVYSKRKFVDNLKKLRLKPSLPSGLVPMGQQDPGSGFTGRGGEGEKPDDEGGGGGGGGGGEGGVSVPVSQSSSSAAVKSPTYTDIIPTVTGRRPSLFLKDEEMEDASFGRGVTQGGRIVMQQQQQQQQQKLRGEADDNMLNVVTEGITPGGGTVVSSESFEYSASPSTSEPLLCKSYMPQYISPYFSESEGEGRDTSATNPLFSGGYVSLSGQWNSGEEGGERGEGSLSPPSGTWSGGKSSRSGSSGGGSGYVLPSECIKPPGMSVTPIGSEYVKTQHMDHIVAGSRGYVQADAIPHLHAVPEGGDDNKYPGESGWYVSVDFPMARTIQAPSSSRDTADTTHDPMTTTTDSPASSHDPEDSIPSTVSLKGDVDGGEEQKQIERPSYVSLPDAQLNMERMGGKHTAPSDDKLGRKGSESHEKPLRPASDAPAAGYIAVQPPDFGKPEQKEDTEGKTEDEETTHYYDSDFISSLLSKSGHALQGFPGYLVSPVLPVRAPDASGVPSEDHTPGISCLARSTGVDGYVPVSTAAGVVDTCEKENSRKGVNSWFSSLMAPRTGSVTSEASLTGISFTMVDNNPSRSCSVSGGTDIKETNVDSGSVEGSVREEGEGGTENEHISVDGLPKGYSRVGEPPE